MGDDYEVILKIYKVGADDFISSAESSLGILQS